MLFSEDSNLPEFSQEEKTNSPDIVQKNDDTNTDDEDIEAGDPPLDEEDLEENNLTVEEADNIVWDAPEGSADDEEKDITG